MANPILYFEGWLLAELFRGAESPQYGFQFAYGFPLIFAWAVCKSFNIVKAIQGLIHESVADKGASHGKVDRFPKATGLNRKFLIESYVLGGNWYERYLCFRNDVGIGNSRIFKKLVLCEIIP